MSNADGSGAEHGELAGHGAVEHRHRANRGKAVTLELFFDLVFVFAFTQVTALLAKDLTWTGLGRGLAVLALLWWAWVGYSWLASAVDPEEGWIRLAFFVAMAMMFVVALATSDPFGASAVVFAGAYFGVRVTHALVFFVVARDDAKFKRAVVTLLPGFVVSPTLILVAAFSDGPTRGVLWALAFALDFSGPFFGGAKGWRINPSHFAERHGLIVIIALGETIVSVGAGASATGVPFDLATVGVLVVLITAMFWWLYFDIVAIAAERKLHELSGQARNALARDSYSYLHLLLVAGVVLVALGGKKTAADPTRTLASIPAAALGVGSGLYLLTLSALRRRNYGTFNTARLIAAPVTAGASWLAARQISGTAGLVALFAVSGSLVLYESLRNAEARHVIRHHDSVPG